MVLTRLCPLCWKQCRTATIVGILAIALLALYMYAYITPSVIRGYMPKMSQPCTLCNVTGPAGIQEHENKKESLHIVFAKVHKAASTSVMNIIIRYGFSKNLSFMMPPEINNNIISEKRTLSKNDILPTFQNGTYDILCNHVIFNKTVISKYFPVDTKYIAILRDPFDQMVSAFMFYKYRYSLPYITKIPGLNPISTYLQNPKKYEPKQIMYSFTNNRMSLDLGYDPKELANVSQTLALQFIKTLENDFDLIMISEHFDESVVLLRRLLGWKMRDILYISSNRFKKPSFNFSPEDRFRHQKWAWLDNAVYNHFYKVFWRKVYEQGPSFFDEVHAFQSARRFLINFCSQTLKGSERFRVQGTEWNREFEISGLDCSLMMMIERDLVEVARQKHLKRLKDHGINVK